MMGIGEGRTDPSTAKATGGGEPGHPHHSTHCKLVAGGAGGAGGWHCLAPSALG